MFYLYLKIFHIVFVTSWFAGLFYLPRIYVNLAQSDEAVAYEVLLGMAQRLLRFTTILAPIAVITGLYMALVQGFNQGWLHAKLLLVLMVIIYHYYCYKLYKVFAAHNNRSSHRFYRIFNEFPVILLLAIVALVVLKPF